MKPLDEYIKKNYKSFRGYCNKITGNPAIGEELFHEIIVQIYDRPDSFLEAIEGDYIDGFIIKTIKNQWFSKTSLYYNKYKKWNMNRMSINDYVDYLIEEEDEYILLDYISELDEELRKLTKSGEIKWWKAELYRMMFITRQYTTYRDIGEKFNINIATIFYAIKEVKEKLEPHVERIKNRYKNGK